MATKNDPVTGEVLNHKGQRLDEFGREIPDPRVIDPPIGYIKQPPLHELIRQMVLDERIRQELAQVEVESFEEADDFDVDDEFDPTSPYEENFDHLGVSGAAPPTVAPSEPPAPSGSASETPTPPAEPKPG